MVFVAYSVPGWTAGVILLMLLGGGSYWDVFPLGGIQSTAITSESYLAGYLLEGSKAINLPAEVRKEYPDLKDEEIINSNHPAFAKIPADKREKLQKGSHSDLSSFGRFLDKARHMVLPVFCYVLGMFASMTVLMKNSLMENLGQDYVRTAFAKGLSEKTVIFKHALRNSLIPIATGLGHMLSLILAGSYLIEKVFNIKGFGLLGYESLIARDYPVTLGILVIGSLLKLFGNIFSDILYCVIDPRIRFS
jgi:ABC-type dipeptide/oligopeptide/nickel transport system permease component